MGRIRLFPQRQSRHGRTPNGPWPRWKAVAGPLLLLAAWPRPTASPCCSTRRPHRGGRRHLRRHLPVAAQDRQPRAGIGVTLAPSTDLDRLEAAIRPQTRLLWIESPGNPLLSITDIAACAELARRQGVLLGVDNTFATPVLTRPLGIGRRHRDALGHKVPGRPQRPAGRGLGGGRPAVVRPAVLHPERDRGHAGSLGVLPAQPGLEDPGTARPRAVPHGPAVGRVPGARSARATRAVSRACRSIRATPSRHGRWTEPSGPCSASKSRAISPRPSGSPRAPSCSSWRSAWGPSSR